MQVAYENEKFQWALKLAEALLDTKNKVSAAKVTLKKKEKEFLVLIIFNFTV